MASPAIFWYKNLILSSYLTRNYTFQSNIKNTISSHYAMEQTLYNRFFMSARNFSFIQKRLPSFICFISRIMRTVSVFFTNPLVIITIIPITTDVTVNIILIHLKN